MTKLKTCILCLILLLSLCAPAWSGSVVTYQSFKAWNDSTGAPLTGGKVYTYKPGTSTPQTTFSDPACTVPHTNPIILDSNGEAVIYRVSPKKYILTSPTGSPSSPLRTWTDPYTSATDGINVKDYGALGNGIHDDTVAIQAAHDASVADGYPAVVFPAGTYKVTATLNWSPWVSAQAIGQVIFVTPLASGYLFNISNQWAAQPSIWYSQYKVLFRGNFAFNNTNDANTVTCFYFGHTGAAFDDTKAADFISISDISTYNFKGAVEFGNDAFIFNFYNCQFVGNYTPSIMATRYGILQPSYIDNSGEQINFFGCTFDHMGEAIRNNGGMAHNALELGFFGCSFDYGNYVMGALENNSTYTFNNCHFEWTGTTCYFPVVGCDVRINNGWVYAPPGTPADPFFASLDASGTTGSVLRMQNMHWVLPGSINNLVYVNDIYSRVIADDNPEYLQGSYTPTYYINGVTSAKLDYYAESIHRTYTSTWTSGGTAPSLGNGLLTASYVKTGKLVTAQIKLTMGSSTTFGTGAYYFSLPFQAANHLANWHGTAFYVDTGTATVTGMARILSNGTVVEVWTAGAAAAQVGQLVPHTWADTDVLEISITYECVN